MCRDEIDSQSHNGAKQNDTLDLCFSMHCQYARPRPFDRRQGVQLEDPQLGSTGWAQRLGCPEVLSDSFHIFELEEQASTASE